MSNLFLKEEGMDLLSSKNVSKKLIHLTYPLWKGKQKTGVDFYTKNKSINVK